MVVTQPQSGIATAARVGNVASASVNLGLGGRGGGGTQHHEPRDKLSGQP
jgi:hypothetical protein